MPQSLRPFFSYFGGKYRIAPKYPKPRWATIIEPFAGAAGYSVRYPCHRVSLYEVNPKVFGTWEYLINVSQKEILSLPLVFDDVRDLSVCQEAKWLIGWWINHGNVNPCNKPSAWMREGTRPNSYWGEAIRQRIADQVPTIRHWKVYNKSYEDILQRKATWFVDPPYQRSGKCYPFKDIDYESLADWVKVLQGQVLVCEQEGANWLPFKPFVVARGSPARYRTGKSKEMLWTRGLRKCRKDE